MLLSGGGAGGGVVEQLTAGEAIAAGELIAIDTSGEARLADATFSSGLYWVVGAADTAAGAAAIVDVSTAGKLAPVSFASAPSAASNGSRVYLSTVPGTASLSPPTGSGRVLIVAGILQGADGATTTPDVLILPQYISRRP